MIDHIQNTQDHFQAIIIADSISSETSERVTTFQLRYPRVVHSEMRTHRVFSRNASSSRAIPIKTLMGQVENTPFVPLSLGKNGKGMQAKEDLDAATATLVRQVIYEGRQQALDLVQRLSDLGVHKQVANRYTEPWQWISVLVTSTDYENWFALREHPDAEPHIQHLAGLMLQAYNASTPVVKEPGQWHLPYMDETVPGDAATMMEVGQINGAPEVWFHDAFHVWARDRFLEDREEDILMRYPDLLRAAISAGRCARTSYKTFQGTSDIAEDLRLFLSLAQGMPMHASPLEHQVMFYPTDPSVRQFGGNLSNTGAIVQFRKLFKCERSKDARVIRYHVGDGGRLVHTDPLASGAP